MKDITQFLTATWQVWVLIILISVYRLFKPKIKGFFGEKTVSIFLSRLDPSKYKVINDLMVEIDGKTSQIDHVVVSNYGIFVIETKNYKGWIMGDEYSEYWTQVIFKRKEKMYNPIRQNYGHILALKEVFKDLGLTIPFFSIISFSTQADLKVKATTDVVYTINLLKTIGKYKEEVLNEKDKVRAFDLLNSLNITNKESRKKHVSDIKDKKFNNQIKARDNGCPKCGSPLLMRKGKYGDFKGCSGYPKCRYIVK